MKKSLVIGILVLGMSGQAMSMGHPHNLFAARKTIRAKATPTLVRPKSQQVVYVESAPVTGPSGVVKCLLNALVNTCKTRLIAL